MQRGCVLQCSQLQSQVGFCGLCSAASCQRCLCTYTQTRHKHAHQLTCARLHQLDRYRNYTACDVCRRQPPPTPPPSTHMHPSHPHQGLARAEGATCTLGMAAGTTMEFLLPSHSSFTLSLLKTLLPLRETHLHMCSSFSSSSSSSLTKSLLVLVGAHRHLAASQATNTTSRSSSAHWLSSSQSMRAAPGSKAGAGPTAAAAVPSAPAYTTWWPAGCSRWVAGAASGSK